MKNRPLLKAVSTSTSIAQVLRKLNLAGAGGNYRTVKKRISNLDLDTQHFTGQSHLKGKTHNFSPKIPLEKILVEKSTYMGTTKLKKRLIEEGYFEVKCNNCKREKWLSKPIPLELDHVNGEREDNRIEKLRLLCPNCHALTPTYRRAKSSFNKNPKKDRPKGDPNWRTKPKPDQRKVERPSYETLLTEVGELGYRGTGRKYGVSDNAIRKWLKVYENNSKE